MGPGGTVSTAFAELAYVDTPMGALSLRRRREPRRQIDVFEVKLGDEYLMSSLFTVAEVELARLGLAAIDRAPLRVVVGGLGLGYTAAAVLDDPRVGELVVIDALAPVIEWHEARLLPVSDALIDDERCRFVHADFFARVHAGAEGALGLSAGPADVVLVDIDHTPTHVLDESHAGFYTAPGLRALQRCLAPDGVFALWSDDPPDEAFLGNLGEVFDRSRAEVVSFDNFLTDGTSTNTIYLASGRATDPTPGEIRSG